MIEDEVLRYIRLKNRGWLPSRIFRSRWRIRTERRDRATRTRDWLAAAMPGMARGFRFALIDREEARRLRRFRTRFVE